MNEEQAAEILRVVNAASDAFRKTMTAEERTALDAKHANEPEATHAPSANREEAMLDFTVDALQTLAGDIHSVLAQRKENLYRQVLEVYYRTEELSRDPEHAHLIEQVEAMRSAHEKDYGYPPPPRR